MLLGVVGKMGAGKTYSMSVFAYLFSHLLNVPLYANYELLEAKRIQTVEDVWKMENGIFCFDEIWLTMDSRLSKGAIDLTRWINQTRKKKVIVMYTSQSFGQVDLRVRKATDFLFYAFKDHGAQKFTIVDAQYGDVGKTLAIRQPEKFYHLYNTFEVLQPLE